ncbi:MAG: transcriptional regulator [Akkermansiaceae bacterium]|jgi:predicted ArsR family transcriptional regulator|tara:strand:+ start:10437 stop:10739 length:303 start_codon:yes stop_codon:yes gene_type:complete
MIDLSQLDKTIHEKGRLAIMSLLASRAQPWAFQHLKAELGLSDGNLITHLRTLEKYDYIMSKKTTGKGRPQSHYSISKIGQTAFNSYLDALEAIIKLSNR